MAGGDWDHGDELPGVMFKRAMILPPAAVAQQTAESLERVI